MRAAWAVQGLGFLILGAVIYFAVQQGTPDSSPSALTNTNQPTPMDDHSLIIRSPAFEHEQPIPSKYTCDGEDISPPIAIDNIPESTASLALILEDPDAPHGTWDHWVMYNIPPTTSRIGEGETPEGVAGHNSWNKEGYGGPCPPEGSHRYYVKVYALDTVLRIPEPASKAGVIEALKGHVIGTGELLGTYERTQ